MTITLPPEAEQALQEEADRQNKTPEQLAMEALLAGLRNRRIPQSLDELKPRKQPPPGKTAMEMVYGQWPGDETEEELLAALKALDD